MLNILFFGGLLLYFISVVLHFAGITMKKDGAVKTAWIVFLIGFVLHTAYIVARGFAAGRIPMANQFEFATSFLWGISMIYIVLRVKWHANWITVVALPATFFMLSYAALLPREITDLMPALRSAWFGLHIGSAVISYASFLLSGCAAVQYLLLLKKGTPEEDAHMRQIDHFSYRLVALGMLMLTVVILSGALWADRHGRLFGHGTRKSFGHLLSGLSMQSICISVCVKTGKGSVWLYSLLSRWVHYYLHLSVLIRYCRDYIRIGNDKIRIRYECSIR